MTITKNHAITALVMGVCEVVCGILIIVLAVVAANKADVGAGASTWWAGLVFAIPGVVGIIVGITKKNGAMIAFMVLNIIAFVLQGVAAILAGILMALWATALSDVATNCGKLPYTDTCRCSYDNGRQYFDIDGINNCDGLSSLFAVLSALVAFLVIAAIVALSASILGCVAVCCTRNQAQPGVVLQPAQQPPPMYYQPEPTKQ